MKKFFSLLDRNRELGIFLLRIFIGLRLIYGSVDNVISWHRMQEFAAFLESRGFFSPLPCAVLSVYVQFLGGLCLLAGIGIRYAALLLVLNFMVAAWVERQGTVEAMTPALAMLFANILFLFYGADKYTLEKRVYRRSSRKI